MTDQGDDEPGPQRSGFTMLEVLLVGASVLLVAGALCWPLLKFQRPKSEAQRCSNNLRGIAIGLIIYSNDYRFFPHMRSLKADHDAMDVSKVYRTLMHFQYMDNPESYICPSSDDLPILGGRDNTTRWSSKQWSWQGRPNTSQQKPIFQSVDPPVFGNAELSYTARRKPLNATKARSTDIIAADKAERSPSFKTDGAGGGNHPGFSQVAFADGHTERTDKAKGLKSRMIADLLIYNANGDLLDPKTGEPNKPPTPIEAEPGVR